MWFYVIVDGRLAASTHVTFHDEASVSTSGNDAQETTQSMASEQHRHSAHDLDIFVPHNGDLPMVDSQDIEDFFSGIENELNQQQSGLIADPLLSSVGVYVPPVSQRPPPPPYPRVPGDSQYNEEIPGHPRAAMSVSAPPHYVMSEDVNAATNMARLHPNGARIEPEFEHIEDDFGPRRPRPESPRPDSHKQILKWQEDEKLGEMATISPVLYANLNHPNLSNEYPGM